MKKRIVIAISLLILLTTITSQKKIVISKLSVKKINIENNFVLKDEDIKKLLTSIYNKNLFFLKSTEIEKELTKNSFIESYKIKKKYPNTLNIEIFEKKPIAILINKKKKFYLSEKIDLFEFINHSDYQHLPYVFGDQEKFKDFYF